MSDLTPKEQTVFNLIREAADEVALISLREIALALNANSHSAAQVVVDSLISKGMIARRSGGSGGGGFKILS